MVDSLEALKAFDRAVVSAARDNEQITRRSELLEEAVAQLAFVSTAWWVLLLGVLTAILVHTPFRESMAGLTQIERLRRLGAFFCVLPEQLLVVRHGLTNYLYRSR